MPTMAPPPPRFEAAAIDPSGWGSPHRLWLAVSVCMMALLGAAAWLVISDAEQPLPPFLRAGSGGEATPGPTPRATSELRLAGSGSNLPMTRALSAAFPRDQLRPPVVHASIGSGGGVRALLDGVIDIALVSRPLREGEREQGLVVTPYARVPVAVAVHASVPDRALDPAELVEIFAGRHTTWSDGSPVVVLQREQGDSSHTAVGRVLADFEAVNEAAYREGRWRVLVRDDLMREALAETPGAVGLYGQGALPAGLPIEAMAVDGVQPSPETIEGGRYPYAKDLAFVTRGPPRGQAAAFIEFTRSEAGRRIIRRAGGLPLPLRPPAAAPSDDDPAEEEAPEVAPTEAVPAELAPAEGKPMPAEEEAPEP